MPHLFTQWWLFWNASCPQAFPKLPEALDSLTEREKADLQSRPALPRIIDKAAEALWASKYQPVIELMLMFYHARPNIRNGVQHPTPSATFARSFIRSCPEFTENGSLKLLESIIDTGKRYEHGQWVSLFNHGTTTTALPLDNNHLLRELETTLCTNDVGTKGATRQREVDDEGTAAKKPKGG